MNAILLQKSPTGLAKLGELPDVTDMTPGAIVLKVATKKKPATLFLRWLIVVTSAAVEALGGVVSLEAAQQNTLLEVTRWSGMWFIRRRTT